VQKAKEEERFDTIMYVGVWVKEEEDIVMNVGSASECAKVGALRQSARERNDG